MAFIENQQTKLQEVTFLHQGWDKGPLVNFPQGAPILQTINRQSPNSPLSTEYVYFSPFHDLLSAESNNSTMTTPKRTPFEANVQQYSCGFVSGRTNETRRLDCPNCGEITNLARTRAFCDPRPHKIKVPQGCEHASRKGEVVPANSTHCQPPQAGSTTTQPAQTDTKIIHELEVFCKAIATRFVCHCANRVEVKRSHTCPCCHNISHLAKQSALRRPQPVPANAERICDECML
jgi:hypothetical protein